jgi:small GTP-binding protein
VSTVTPKNTVTSQNTVTLQKKICLLGAQAVGKTSLVKRFVESLFSETYKTTVGVKIDKKQVAHSDQDITLILWDIHGEDKFQRISQTYLRGMAGYLLVVDGTRPETLGTARDLEALAAQTVGGVPFVLLVNKVDLKADWGITPEHLQDWRVPVFYTSAKTGEGVEEAFAALTRAMLEV